ncbi:MAG: hypothetical protein ACYSUM_21135, partial [Planctomycetota bacterium]
SHKDKEIAMWIGRLTAALILIPAIAACSGGGGGGAAAGALNYTTSDFQSVQDFVDNPLVQQLLGRGNLTVNDGGSPPNVEGSYDATMTIEIHDVQPGEVGQTEVFSFWLFDQVDEDIGFDDLSDFGIIESRAFVTGNSDTAFTIWHVCTSDLLLADCQVVLARIITGSRLTNGDLSVRSGQTIVGWLGSECNLLGDPAPPGSMIVGGVDAAYQGAP